MIQKVFGRAAFDASGATDFVGDAFEGACTADYFLTELLELLVPVWVERAQRFGLFDEEEE